MPNDLPLADEQRLIPVIDDIPKAERDKRNEKCNKCETRKWYAKRLDFHFDWLDCPYDCTNDLEHLMRKGARNE